MSNLAGDAMGEPPNTKKNTLAKVPHFSTLAATFALASGIKIEHDSHRSPR